MELQDSSACIWCSAPENARVNFRAYISIPAPDWANTANEGISHCMDCVKMYHHGRAAFVADNSNIEQVLFPIEVKRLCHSLKECITDLAIEHKDVVDRDSDVFNYWGSSQQEACPLPVPVQEILRFPFYLQDEGVNKMFCKLMKVLHRTDQLHITAVDEPLAGLFMLLIHPDNMISNWANKSVAHLGNSAIERTDEFTHVISLMLSVISFCLFRDRTVSVTCEEVPSARRILSSHLFPNQQLVYWQGLSSLLCWISEENLNLLGSELHSDITRIYQENLKTSDESNSFWPKLLGFQQLLDKLGFRIWQYLNDAPDVVFNSIFNHPNVRSKINHLKIKFTKFEHLLANSVNEAAPYTWIKAFVSSFLEYESIAEQCITMVLDKMINEINEELTNQTKPNSNQSTRIQKPSVFIEHSVSSLVEILECLIKCNFFCVSLPCFERSFNVVMQYLKKFHQNQGSSQQFTSWQSSPLRFIRNLLNICVEKEISLTESQLLIKDIDLVWKKDTRFTNIDHNLLSVCVQNLVKHLRSIGIDDTVKVCNDEGASTSAASEENEDYCSCIFKPFVSIKEEILENDFPEPSPDYMFEDSSITNNFVEPDEIILISSDSEDDLPEVTGLVDDQVVVKEEFVSRFGEDVSDAELLWHHGFTRDVTVEIKKLTLEDIEHLRHSQYAGKHTVQESAVKVNAPKISEDTLPYARKDAVQESAVNDNALKTSEDTLSYARKDTVQEGAVKDNAPKTSEDILPYARKHTVQESAVKDNAPKISEDTLPYKGLHIIQSNASNTVIDISSDTSADDVPGIAKDTSYYYEDIEHLRRAKKTMQDTEQDAESSVKEESLDKEDTLPYRGLYTPQNTASNLVITISSDSSDDETETAKETLHHYTPYKYTDDIIRDIKKSSAEKLREAQQRIKMQKDIIAKERRRQKNSVITSSDSEDENSKLPTKRSLKYSHDRRDKEATSSSFSCSNFYRTVPTENAKSDSDFDEHFLTLKNDQRAGETLVQKKIPWISPKRTPRYFGHVAKVESSDISSSDIEPQVELQVKSPNAFKRNIFLDIWKSSKEMETSTVPPNRSQTLVDKQLASESRDNPQSSNRITQRKNILPITSVSEPNETLPVPERIEVEASSRYHEQRVPKPRHKEKHINRFSSRNASFAQDLETTHLKSKKTSNTSVTQCQEFPSRSDKQVPSEAVSTCLLTTADTQETNLSSRNVATTTGQYKYSKKNVNLIASRVINCDSLVAVVLSWDPLWLDRQVKPEQIARKLGMHLQKIPVVFDSIDSYINVFVPLLLLETWHYVLQEYQKIKGTKTKCMNMKYFQHWRNPDILSGFFLKCKRQIFSKSWCPSVLDLVILSLSTSAEENPSYHVFAMVTKTDVQHIKGKGQASQPTFMLEVEVQVPALNENILAAYIQENDNIQIQTISSMISHHRLFMCFKNLNKHVLTRDILSPRVRPVQEKIDSPNPAELITKLNACQSEAADKIFSCMETELMIPSISLLHGPPGTGKTRTIINIIERILKKIRPVDNSPLLPGQTRNIMDNRPRILVCAPSNTAVDRLVLNVVEMCLAENHEGKRSYDPRFNCGLFTIVRVGYNVNEKCMRYQLSNIVNKQIQKASGNVETEKLRKEIVDCQKELQQAELRCGNLKFSSKPSAEELQQAERKRDDLEKHLKHLKSKDIEPGGQVNSKSMRELVLRHADVVFCTLNGSGSNLLDIPNTNRQHDFKYVIVDEACQCTELDTLIPLQFKGSKLLLVGDPHQLPATVLSEKAKELGFQRSLFERMYTYFKTLNLPINPVHLLRTQYRMHPEICSFPSKHFYNNKLQTYAKIEQRYESFPFKPYLVFDIIEGRERSIDRNITNEAECEMVLALLSPLVAIEKLRIGIITPYKQQKSLLESRVNKRLASTDEIKKKIEISTVDGFQGQEKDVIILSCVRARGSSIGFVADRNRMNVALTRAKMALYIVGHFRTLQMNEDWKKLLVDAKERKLIHPVHNGQYEAAAELCRKDQESHNNENRTEFESRPGKEVIGPGRKPCKEVNRQEKVRSKRKKTPDEGDRVKGQDGASHARQHRQPFEAEIRGHGRVIGKDNVPNESASNAQHKESSANLPHAGQTEETIHMERSGEGFSSVGSEDHNMEPLEEGEIRDELVPYTSSSKSSKKGKKSDKDLAAVTESLRSKYPRGPLLKVIPHLPSIPNEHRKKQNRNGKQKEDHQNEKHEHSRTWKKKKHKKSSSSETQKFSIQQSKRHGGSRTNGNSSRTNKSNSRNNNNSSRTNNNSSRTNNYSSRTNDNSSRTNDNSSRTNNNSSRTNDNSSRTNEGKSGRKRKWHSPDGNLGPNQKQTHRYQREEPLQKHKRLRSSDNGEPSSGQQHRRKVNNDNQERRNTQTDRHSPTTSTTSPPQPKVQQLHRGKKRVAHTPRQQSAEQTSPDLESTPSCSHGNEIPNGHSVQSEASHANTMHLAGSSSRSSHTRSILSTPSEPKSKSVTFSPTLTEVHIVEKYIANQWSSE